MIDTIYFLKGLLSADIRFVTGVPDSLLKDVCAHITCELSPECHIIATNEGSAVGLAIGHYLVTSRPALVYMQNSGLGNVVNPLTSLADPKVCGIPMVLMIGWRGEVLDDESQISDEPQHVKQGRITLSQLDTLGIPYTVLSAVTPSEDIEGVLKEAVAKALACSGPVALVIRKNTFSRFEFTSKADSEWDLSREDAIRVIVDSLPSDTPIVSTTGMASRELFELRREAKIGHQGDFLSVGGMGHANQIAAGIAFARPGSSVVCIDGDGAVLMHAGGLAIGAECPNLFHIVLNNAAHDSVGGQPTKGEELQFDKLAKAFGYRYVDRASTADELRIKLKDMVGLAGSAFLEVRCRRGARTNLGRPDRSPQQNKEDFMRFLGSNK
jgi:phosphonopyruvate decarboxylase